MFYLDQETRKRYRIGTPFTYGDVNYTYTGASHNTFMSLGFKQVIEAPRPDDRFFIVNSPCNDDGSWSYSERPLDQVQQGFCSQQVQAAQDNLKSSDYMYARAAENMAKFNAAGMKVESVGVPAAVTTERDQVRAVCESNCSLIMAPTTIAALEKLVKAPAEVAEDPMAQDRKMITNPEPHLEPLPTIDVSAYLTAELI